MQIDVGRFSLSCYNIGAASRSLSDGKHKRTSLLNIFFLHYRVGLSFIVHSLRLTCPTSQYILVSTSLYEEATFLAC